MVRVRSQRGDIIADGPFTETKELFSGIVSIEAANFEEAVSIAKTCSILVTGEEILVLPHYGE